MLLKRRGRQFRCRFGHFRCPYGHTDQWVRLPAWVQCFIVTVVVFELRLWDDGTDRQTDGSTDGQIAASAASNTRATKLADHCYATVLSLQLLYIVHSLTKHQSSVLCCSHFSQSYKAIYAKAYTLARNNHAALQKHDMSKHQTYLSHNLCVIKF